jgi:phosphinothricin acetyltransferase
LTEALPGGGTCGRSARRYLAGVMISSYTLAPDTASTSVVRDATAADLPAVAAIYTHYVLRTTTTCNTEVRTPREWTERFDALAATGTHALLVAVRDGQVAGYVETQPLRAKPAYARSVELSVYVAPDAVGTGVGGALYAAVLKRLAGGSFHRAYAVIALPNPGSVAFHERFGFVHRGTLTEAGHKFGRYLDVAFYERDLDDGVGVRGGGSGPAASVAEQRS